MRIAEESQEQDGCWYVHVARGHILTELDRLDDARSTLYAGRRLCEELGLRLRLPSLGVFLGFELFIAGEWDDAMAEIEAALELAEETGETYSVTLARVVTSLISFHRNDLNRAAAAVDAAYTELGSRGSSYRHSWAAWPHALLQEAAGQSGQALRTMTPPWEESVRLGISVEHPVVGADLVRLALAEGETGLARQVAAAVAETAAGNDLAWLHGAALRCRGLAENDVHTLTAAVDAYADGSRPLEVALASEDAATTFIKQGDAQSARPLLDQAISIYERLGAARDLARADAVLRRAGIRRGIRGARNRPEFGWESLTPTELTVVGLVAGGLSNLQIGERLFISRRTVQTHLAHVFAKLGISSRAQLAAEAARRHDVPARADG